MNGVSPSCSAGTSRNDAVNETPGTVADASRARGCPFKHMALLSAHARAGSRIAMSAACVGSMLTAQPGCCPG